MIGIAAFTCCAVLLSFTTRGIGGLDDGPEARCRGRRRRRLGILDAGAGSACRRVRVAANQISLYSLMPVFGAAYGLAEATNRTASGRHVDRQHCAAIAARLMSERFGARAMMLVCAANMLLALSLPAVITTSAALPVLLIMGGVGYGVYTMTQIELGTRFRGAQLVAGNSAFGLMWGVGGIAGPPGAGALMQVVAAKRPHPQHCCLQCAAHHLCQLPHHGRRGAQPAEPSMSELRQDLSEMPVAAIAGITATVTVFAISQGLSYPLLSFILQRQGVSPGMIGLSAAMTPLGFIVSSLVVPALTNRFGAGRVAVACALTAGTLLALIGWQQNIWLWFPLRFLLGFFANPLYVISETWLLAVTPAAKRGRIMGVYTSMISAGFAMGPLTLALVGTEGWPPFAVGVSAFALCAMSLVLVLPRLPDISGDHGTSVLAFARSRR
jgi:MFS family permease